MNLFTYFQQEWLHNLFGVLLTLVVVWMVCSYRNHHATQKNAGVRIYSAHEKKRLTELGKKAFRSGSLNGGKVYRHKGNKKDYTIIFLTNWISDKPSFPIMVTYSDNFSNLYTRVIHEFMDRFEYVGTIQNDVPSASEEIMARVHNMTKREGDNGVFLVTPYAGEIWESLECVIATEFTKKRVVIEDIANKGTAQPIVIFYDEDRKNICAMNQYNFIHKYSKRMVRGKHEVFLGSVNREALENSGIPIGNFVEVTEITTTSTGDTVTLYDGMHRVTLSGLQGLSVGETFAVCSGYGLILSLENEKETTDQESDQTLEIVSEDARNFHDFIKERQWDLNTMIFTVDKILKGRRAVFSYLAPDSVRCDMATLPMSLYYANLKLGEKYKFTGSRFERVSFSSVPKPDITVGCERILREAIEQKELTLTEESARILKDIFGQDGLSTQVTQLEFISQDPEERLFHFEFPRLGIDGSIEEILSAHIFFKVEPQLNVGDHFLFDGNRLTYATKEKKSVPVESIELDSKTENELKLRGVKDNDTMTAGKPIGNRATLLRTIYHDSGAPAGIQSISITHDRAEKEFPKGRKFIYRDNNLYPITASTSSYISKINLIGLTDYDLDNATYGAKLEIKEIKEDGTITFIVYSNVLATVKVDVGLMPTELFRIGSKYSYEVNALILIED